MVLCCEYDDCTQPGRQVCSRCRKVSYCSIDHQRLDWKREWGHKDQCLPCETEEPRWTPPTVDPLVDPCAVLTPGWLFEARMPSRFEDERVEVRPPSRQGCPIEQVLPKTTSELVVDSSTTDADFSAEAKEQCVAEADTADSVKDGIASSLVSAPSSLLPAHGNVTLGFAVRANVGDFAGAKVITRRFESSDPSHSYAYTVRVDKSTLDADSQGFVRVGRDYDALIRRPTNMPGRTGGLLPQLQPEQLKQRVEQLQVRNAIAPKLWPPDVRGLYTPATLSRAPSLLSPLPSASELNTASSDLARSSLAAGGRARLCPGQRAALPRSHRWAALDGAAAERRRRCRAARRVVAT